MESQGGAGQGPPPEMMKMMMEKGGPNPEMMKMMMEKGGGPPPEMMKMMMEKGGGPPPEMMKMMAQGGGPPPEMMKMMMEKGGDPAAMIRAMLEQKNTCHNGQYLPITAGLVTQERLDALEKFEFREDDVIVASFPKAGTHWAQDICAKIMMEGDLERAEVNARPLLELTPKMTPQDGKHAVATTLEEMAALPSPRVLGTHLYYNNLPASVQQTKKPKIVYIWRDCKDCIVSNYKPLKAKIPAAMMPSDEKMIDILAGNDRAFGTWPGHLRNYFAEANNPQVLIINYEDMKKDLLSTVRRVAAHLGKSLPEDTLVKISESSTIEAAKKTHEGSMFIGQGQSGQWREFLTVAQSEMIDAYLKEQDADSIPFPK